MSLLSAGRVSQSRSLSTRCHRWLVMSLFFFFQAEDGIRDLVRSRGLGDVYKRQVEGEQHVFEVPLVVVGAVGFVPASDEFIAQVLPGCLLYTSDAAAERSSVDLGGRRIFNKKKQIRTRVRPYTVRYTRVLNTVASETSTTERRGF